MFYIIYTSNLPLTFHNNHAGENSYDSNCKACGSLTCYADDSTYTVSSNEPTSLSEKITSKYRELSNFMLNNKLVLNSEKTNVMVLASSFKHRKHGNFGVTLNTGNEIVEPVEFETLLGAHLFNNFQWNHHICDARRHC